MADRRRLGNRSIGSRDRRTGTCNVCSAPCSSCMHRNAKFNNLKLDESSDENSHGVVASLCSFNEDDIPLSSRLKSLQSSLHGVVARQCLNEDDVPLSSRIKDLHSTNNTASELVSSIHDTSSSKETIRSSSKDESPMHSEESGMVGKSEESNVSATSESRSADSEMKVDVNVCDTCGDAGSEHLLAICSRCSDGAEHTYCMRVMLKKVPRGEWLCEECKFNEEAEKKKLLKRPIDKPEAAPEAKRQAVEAPTGPHKTSVASRLAALSWETSFKGLEKTTRKQLAHNSSFNSHSSDDENTQLQSLKGSLLKSNSFSSSSAKAKARTVDYDILKERFSRTMSNRCIDVGSSGFDESKRKGSKQLKDHSTEANPPVPKDDQKRARKATDTGSSEQISAEAKRKDELADVNGLSRSSVFREVREKIKEAVRNRQKPDLLSVPKGQNVKEEVSKGNSVRAAVEAVLRKNPSFNKNRVLEQSDLPSISNMDASCDKTSQNLPFKVPVPVVRDWPVGLKGFQAIPGPSQTVEPKAHLPCVEPVRRDFPVVITPSVLSTTSAIPKPEYIWQGDMEVQKSKSMSALHCGIQAYPSTLASPKVADVVNQFPVKLTLNQVPRLSIWPKKFQEISANEEHIALFFFAKDTESYEKSYKPLVDGMIQKDLALKVNLESVELLIFASNQLPQNCQRWNMLYFLWGVFRGKRKKRCTPRKNNLLPVDETEEGEIGASLQLRDGKKSRM